VLVFSSISSSKCLKTNLDKIWCCRFWPRV